MSPRQAGRAVVVCTLILGVLTAAAQPPRRPVAVIELSGSEPNRQLAKEIWSELNNHADLKPIDSTDLIQINFSPVRDENMERIQDASREKQTAEDRIGAYSYAEAAKAADEALRHLERAAPIPQVLELYAEIAFVLGVARLGERKPAADSFRLARKVNPSFKPDPIRYLPEVVQDFETAVKTTSAATGKLDIALAGRVFIDGHEVGSGPAWFDATTGTHVVWVIEADRLPHAKRVTIVPGQKERPEIEDRKATIDLKVQRARFALKTAPDGAARATAMKQLAALLEVKDVVLLTSVNGKTVIQTWTEKEPGFSALHEREKDEKAIDILKPFLPEKVVVIPPPRKPDPPKPPPPDTRSWYEKPRYQISGGVAAVALIVTGIVLFRSWDRSVGLNDDPQFGTRR